MRQRERPIRFLLNAPDQTSLFFPREGSDSSLKRNSYGGLANKVRGENQLFFGFFGNSTVAVADRRSCNV